jgi:hypothetical protein
MEGTSRAGFWKRLVQWRNLAPGLTILGAVIAVTVQLLQRAKVDPMLDVIVGLLVLLAVDALVTISKRPIGGTCDTRAGHTRV